MFGLLPIPFFFDEAALVIATGVLFLFHRERVREAWATTAQTGSGLALAEQDESLPTSVEDEHEPGVRIGPPPTGSPVEDGTHQHRDSE
jgi:hypothetical protein